MPSAKFELTRSNIAVVIITAIAYSAFMVSTTMKVGVPVGGLIFTLLVFALVPTFVSWLTWLISGRSRTAGNIAFHATLGLILVGVGWLLTTAMGTARVAANSQEEFRKAVREHDAAMGAAITRWEEAGRPIKTKEMFDFATLVDEGETARRKETLNKYIAAADEMSAFMPNAFREQSRKFDAIQNPTPYVREAIKEAEKNGREEQELILPLLDMTKKLGRDLLRVVDLLEKNRSRWKVDGGQIAISDEKLESEVTAALTGVQQSAVDVDKQSQLLIKIGTSRSNRQAGSR